MPHEAIAILKEGLSMAGVNLHPLLLTSLSRAEAIVGLATSQPAPQECQKETEDPLLLAELYVALGEMTKAFVALDQATDARHYRLAAVNMFPQFELLRQDPRYDRILARMGLRR
jgi:hypothetical protein